MKPKKPKNRQPTLSEFRNNRYSSGKIYGAHLPLHRGYGVAAFDFNPADKQPNGRMVNVKGEKIDFYIEEIETGFEMAGTTAQSHRKRQFFPHNMVQPAITIRGRANNSFQYNRLASFVRVSQYQSLDTQQLRKEGVPLRTLDTKVGTQIVPTLRLIIRNGSGRNALKGGRYPFGGKNVKGRHQGWILEGYVRNIAAGAKRHDPAPAFEFQFMVAESQQNGQNIGIWSDTAVAGNAIKPWIEVFKSRGKKGFVRGDRIESGGVNGDTDFIDTVGDVIDDVIDGLEDL